MKKLLRFAFVFLLIMIVLLINLPITVLAENIEQQINNKEATDKHGEVIIMYEQKDSKQKIMNEQSTYTPSFLDGLNVEDSITFEDVNEDKISNNKDNNLASQSQSDGTNAYNNGKTSDLVVSLIKSDKYSTEELIDKLSKEKSIKHVQKNHKFKVSGITNDIYEKYQWAIENTGQNAGISNLDINPEKITNQSSDEKVIAILDTGVDYNHEDLKDRMWNNPFEKSGLLQGQHGYDFFNNNDKPMDDNGHGTHIAGIISAEANNNQGITGAVLDKTNIKIMALKFTNKDGKGYDFAAISAYNYIYQAQKLGINVIAVNNSWGENIENKDKDYLLEMAIDLVGNGPNHDGKGALSICAAGNESVNTDKNLIAPACFDSDYIISVAASNEKDELASFSNYGKDTVDIVAPGTNILSTVSYNCFNPAIYENKEELCDKFEDFNSGIGNFEYMASDGIVTTTTEEFFGNSGQSLKWHIDAKAKSTYVLSIPYTQKNSEQFLSYMFKYKSNVEKAGEIYNTIDTSKKIKLGYKNLNFWEHIYDHLSVESDGIMELIFYANKDAKIDIFLDDFAISKAGIAEEQLQKYNFYNGTSMATPFVTAVVGICSNYEEKTALDKKEWILSSARKVEGLTDKVSTCGVIDVDNLVNPKITIKEVNMSKDGKLTINVDNMSEMPTVLINDKIVKAKKINSEKLQVIDKNLINTTVKITLKINDTNFATAKVYLNVGKDPKLNYSFIDWEYDIEDIITDGKNIYIESYELLDGYVDPYYSSLYIVDRTDEEDECDLNEIAKESKSLKNLLGEQYEVAYDGDCIYDVTNSNIVFIGNKAYTIFTVDYQYSKEIVLAYCKLNNNDSSWKKIGTLPTEYYSLSNYTLGSYNGNLYVIGGYNEEKDIVSNLVYKYDVKDKKWSTVAELPEGRFYSKVTQVGDKLLVSFGGTDSGEVPSILIFDGNEWRKSNAKITINQANKTCGNREYYKVGTGLVKNGLIFSGINAEQYGNIFYYDMLTDSFRKSGYNMDDMEGSEGIAVGDEYYILKKYEDYDYYIIESIPIETGLSKLSITHPDMDKKLSVNNQSYKSTKNSNNITDTYYYMPGNTVDIKLSDTDGKYIKDFKIDGKQIEGYEYKATINSDKDVKITMAKSNSLIKLNKTSADLSSFETLKLSADLKNKNATNVKWSTSDSKLATVSSNGTVTPKWKANGKSVYITASSTYRGRNVKVKSKINIEQPTLKNLKVSKITTKSANLSWSKIKGADGYKIYKYNKNTKKYELYKTIKSNNCTITKLNSKTSYKFRVIGYKKIDGKVCNSKASTIACKTK